MMVKVLLEIELMVLSDDDEIDHSDKDDVDDDHDDDDDDDSDGNDVFFCSKHFFL